MKYNVFETINNPEAFKLFLKTILNLPTNVDFFLEVTDTKITIKSVNPKFIDNFNSLMQSPNALRSHLKYSINRIQTSSATHQANSAYPTPISLQKNMGKNFFEKLFSEAQRKKIGGSPDTEADNFIVYSKIQEQDDIEKELINFQIQDYRKTLAKADFFELRKAIAQNNAEPLPRKGSNYALTGPLAPYVNKIIYLDEKMNSVCFNYGFLLNCLTPPELISSEENEFNQINIMLNKQHFLSYMTTILPESFILQTDSNNNNQVSPICFGSAANQKPVVRISLVLDCSSSMHTVLTSYIAHLKNFIAKLTDSEASKFIDQETTTIRIVPFQSQKLFEKEFKLSNKNDIFQFMSSLNTNGGTRLIDTANEEIQFLENNDMTNSVDVAIVFTDGADNESRDKQLIKPKKVRIFAMGLGTTYDKDLLEDMAIQSGGQHINLTNINDFDQILKYITEFSVAQRVFEFTQEARKFIVTVPEGAIVVAKDTLELGKPFTMGEISYEAFLSSMNSNQNDENEIKNKVETPLGAISIDEIMEYIPPSYPEVFASFLLETYQTFGHMTWSYIEPLFNYINYILYPQQETPAETAQNSNLSLRP